MVPMILEPDIAITPEGSLPSGLHPPRLGPPERQHGQVPWVTGQQGLLNTSWSLASRPARCEIYCLKYLCLNNYRKVSNPNPSMSLLSSLPMEAVPSSCLPGSRMMGTFVESEMLGILPYICISPPREAARRQSVANGSIF